MGIGFIKKVGNRDVNVDDTDNPLPVTLAGAGGTTLATNITQSGSVTLESTSTAAGGLPVYILDPATGLRAAIVSIVSVIQTSDYPSGATPVQVSSGNVAAASAIAAMPAVSAKTNYCSGFEITGSGATLGSAVTVTLAGLLGGTRSYTVNAVAGVLLGNTPLVVQFSPPLPASAVNTAITLTCPSLGAGSTNNVASIRGYVL